MSSAFFHPHSHDFLRVAVAVPMVALAQPQINAQRTVALMAQAVVAGARVVVFPELGLTGYSCDDLFHQEALLDAARVALDVVVQASAGLSVLTIVGLPVRHQGRLFNCAAVVAGGKIHGLIPKTYLPNYREFYEGRQFTPATGMDPVEWPHHPPIPFGTHLLFHLEDQPLATFSIEICEDLWVPIPPSSMAALAGATIILNPSASNATVGKADYRRQLVANQSGRCLAAYLYSAAGVGESTTDVAWDGHGLIADYGEIKAESQRYAIEDQLVLADIDLARLHQERMRQNTFARSTELHRSLLQDYQSHKISLLPVPQPPQALLTPPARFPYVPELTDRRQDRCAEVFHIQVQGLASRLRATGLQTLILGVSGGLDSAHALLVSCAVLDQLKLPRQALRAYTMPGFATAKQSLTLAHQLMQVLGVTAEEIDIRPSCLQMFKDINHPYGRGEHLYDITFENVQAGERTSHLFRLANRYQGLVVGTSDLSELALGWSTYGVGDHMAHYHVNSSVPKTLIQHLLRWIQTTDIFTPGLRPLLDQVLAVDISPELVPGSAEAPVQRSEDTVGPYALQDFFLYHTLRFGYRPQRIAYMAWCAWGNSRSPSPHELTYGFDEIRHWLGVFTQRFFQGSQFKRSCIANGPKVGSGGSLSPRGDWRAPSDNSAAVWWQAVQSLPLKEPQ
ncbi:MAG: NAD(+) synthase [Ferrovum sp.]|nr:NAD(+) synthase [Ferrovum sp.]